MAEEKKTAPALEGGQEWEKPQEEVEKPRRGRRPKAKEAPPGLRTARPPGRAAALLFPRLRPGRP